MAENIKSRKNYRVYNGSSWDTMHFTTDANSVDANDGDTMETKVGAIKGITTSTEVTEEGYAADATTVAALNSSLGGINFITEDGKGITGYTLNGADTVYPFKRVIDITDLKTTTGTTSYGFSYCNFDVSSIEGYQNLTVENFVFCITGISMWSTGGMGSPYANNEYNSSTGIFTLYTRYITTNSWNYGINIGDKAYIIF